jgi:RNA polymerase sigma-70 factor (ECF subfamily)
MDVVEMWKRYYGELTGYIRKDTSSLEAAEDIASQVFLQAVKHQSLLATMSPKQCRAWLYTSTKRMLIDLARRKRLESRIIPEPDGVEDDLSAAVVSEVIGMLPEDLQDLVAMRYFADMDSVTIGKELGITPATVRTRLRKACALLRKYWNKE